MHARDRERKNILKIACIAASWSWQVDRQSWLSNFSSSCLHIFLFSRQGHVEKNRLSQIVSSNFSPWVHPPWDVYFGEETSGRDFERARPLSSSRKYVLNFNGSQPETSFFARINFMMSSGDFSNKMRKNLTSHLTSSEQEAKTAAEDFSTKFFKNGQSFFQASDLNSGRLNN